MNIDHSALGFGHFIAQADIVGKTLLVILIAMSIASWAIIAVKGLSLLVRKSRGRRASCSCSGTPARWMRWPAKSRRTARTTPSRT